jgi:ubiquinone/menaquinone biosynthesis C-methylase UbiE
MYADHLRGQIEDSEADREARLAVIEAQGARIAALEAEVHRWLGETQRLQEALLKAEAERNELRMYADLPRCQIEDSEADREARLAVIEAQGARIAALEAEVHRWLGETKKLQEATLKAEEGAESGASSPGGQSKLKAFKKAIKRKVGVRSRSMVTYGDELFGRPLAALKRGIDDFNNSQSNKTLLNDIRLFNHKMVDQFDENFTLKGSMFLDIGASPHGYAMERALEKGVACYVGIGLDIGEHGYVTGEANNTGILLNMDATALKFPDAFFDAVMSASAFEHIIDVSAALAEIERVLKPGGCALISFEPVWSCSYGHHLHHLAGCSGVIPPWAHLMWPRDQMEAFLSDKWPRNAPFTVEQAIEWIYSGDSINRLNVREFRWLFAGCPLETLWMVELREENKEFNQLTIKQCSDLTGLDPDELTTKGLSILLKKK